MLSVLVLVLVAFIASVPRRSSPNILGYNDLEDGRVKYAYEGSALDSEVSAEVQQTAKANNVEIIGEIVERRTANSRTFETSDPDLMVTEIVSGGPQYHKDVAGNWSQVEYAVLPAHDFQTLAARKPGSVQKVV